MQVKKQQLELDMEQQTGSKLGKEHIKAVNYHPAYLPNPGHLLAVGGLKHAVQDVLCQLGLVGV